MSEICLKLTIKTQQGRFNDYVTRRLPFLNHLPPTITLCHVCSREPSCITSRPAKTKTHPPNLPSGRITKTAQTHLLPGSDVIIESPQNDVIDIVFLSLLLTLKRFHTLFWCFHCWLCINQVSCGTFIKQFRSSFIFFLF